jgi:enoyl-CoA hydratase/carnithine racemase
MTQWDTITLAVQGQVAVMTLNRPDRANAITFQLTCDINDALDAVEQDDNVRAILLTGAGDRHFCAGADLREIESLFTDAGELGDPRQDFIRHFETISKPVVAVINGSAMGGGCEISLACDFRFIASSAVIGLPEIGFGALPAGGGTQRLPRIVGLPIAKSLILTGKPVSAERALEINLVDRVCAPEDLMKEAMSFTEELASRAPYAMVAGKHLLNAALELPLDEGLALERRVTNEMGDENKKEEARKASIDSSDTYRRIFKDD